MENSMLTSRACDLGLAIVVPYMCFKLKFEKLPLAQS